MATIVKGDPKDPFSIATALRCWEGCYSFPLIAPLYPWSISYNCWVLSKVASRTNLWESLVWLDKGCNPGLLGHCWTLYPLYHWDPWSQCLGQERKKYFVSLLIWRQNHSTVSEYLQPINMIMIYYWDKKLKKRLHILEVDIIIIKKNNIDLMSLAQRMHFLQDVFQMTAIALVSVINHYYINGLHLI